MIALLALELNVNTVMLSTANVVSAQMQIRPIQEPQQSTLVQQIPIQKIPEGGVPVPQASPNLSNQPEVTIQREGSAPSQPAQVASPHIQVDEKIVLPKINELLSSWGYQVVGCGNGSASIMVDQEFACVKSTQQLPPGDYIYDRASQTIKPRQTPTAQYTFKDIKAYSDCIEDILQFYQDKTVFNMRNRSSTCRQDVFTQYKDAGITRDQAIGLIRDADFYATSLLTSKLFPLKGQRARIRDMFGFIYTIDR